MKNLALLLTFGAALGAPLAASAAIPHGIASLPATTFSIADIGWEETPLEELRAALDLVDTKPIGHAQIGHAPSGHAQTRSDAIAQKPAAQTSPVAPGPVPSAAKPQDAEREFLVAQFLLQANAGFPAWR